jgi:SNF2 family DNA or RNA helicase
VTFNRVPNPYPTRDFPQTVNQSGKPALVRAAQQTRPFTPRWYQSEIIQHQLETPRNGTHAGMGLGKTVATLSTLDILQLSGDETKPFLVVAPLRVAQSTWPDEVRKWDHLSGMEIVPIVGSASQRHALLFRELRRGNAAGYTINYENLPWLAETLAAAGAGWPFGAVVADESTKLKSFRLRQGGQRAKVLGKVAHTKATRWTNLTGTPAPNGLKDLWGQAWFLDAGARLGRTHQAFQDRWFRTARDGYGLEPLPHAQDEIQRALSDICVTITDGLEVERPLVNEIYVELPATARLLYQEMEKQMFTEIEAHEVEAFHAAARTMKCLQLANGAAYVDDEGAWKEVHDVKIQALEEVIEEAGGAPVLVAYHFKSDLARLQAAFPKGRTLDTDPATIRAWNAGKIPVLFAHPASAGHGLNLQDGGNILAFFSVDWNLELHDQIIERIGPARQKQSGYNRPVFVHYILARDTVDEIVLERLRSKRDVQALLMEAMRRVRSS